jgi:uncharacterized protein
MSGGHAGELTDRIAALDWARLSASIDELNYALTPPLLSQADCEAVAGLYGQASKFRSTVVMSRYGFGRGEYKYFAEPLPAIVQTLRQALYPSLATIANRWAIQLGLPAQWPAEHDALRQQCHAAGQTRPTPLLLRYGPGDYNCLHQDLYGAIHFPLQAVIMLDRPGIDFDGGVLTLVENRPRMQSRCETVALTQGQMAIIPVRERPRVGSRGPYRTQLRHGVSSVHRGLRRTLGIIFHDAA